jgi:catechol 2,3-dioxygenase-like lactoylglutathione lyase family enzyme
MCPFKIESLGEIAIRCIDMDAMVTFYTETIGLEPYSGTVKDGVVFFKVAEGIEGHITSLVLFSYDAQNQRVVHPLPSDPPVSGTPSTLHHFALSLPFSEQEKAIKWFDSIGQDYSIQHFEWVGWRGVFMADPDGNTVELVSKTNAKPS